MGPPPVRATVFVRARGPIQDAIESGAADDYNQENCTWRRGDEKDVCPDPDVRVFLYTEENEPRRELILQEGDWLRYNFDPMKENVILVHGYAGLCKFRLSFLNLQLL